MKPLLFDTSSLYGVTRIRRLREKYPDRAFLLPCIVIAERVNQLRREHGPRYNADLVDNQFIGNEVLAFHQVAFDRQAAEALSEIAYRLGDAWYPKWPETKRDVRTYPCGERCRWGDHAITALAISNQALLVTEDTAIHMACKTDPTFFPTTSRLADLL